MDTTTPQPTGERKSYRRHFIREKKAPPPFKLQKRDIEITRAVFENRFLTRELLAVLFPPNEQDRLRRYRHAETETKDARHTNLLRRLSALFHHGYLLRFQTHIGGEHIYALDNQGAHLLDDNQLSLPLEIDWREKTRDLSNLYVYHALMVAGFRTALTVALKARPTFTLPRFERESKDLKAEWKRQGSRVYVNPDAFFILCDTSQPEGRQNAAYFLEADRSTMQLSRLLEKYARYSEMYQNRKHQEAFGIPSFRVLTITKSKERAQNLLTLVHTDSFGRKKDGEVIPNPIPKDRRPFFYFTTEENYHEHPENLLAAIWNRADEPKEPRAIIGSPLPRR